MFETLMTVCFMISVYGKALFKLNWEVIQNSLHADWCILIILKEMCQKNMDVWDKIKYEYLYIFFRCCFTISMTKLINKWPNYVFINGFLVDSAFLSEKYWRKTLHACVNNSDFYYFSKWNVKKKIILINKTLQTWYMQHEK